MVTTNCSQVLVINTWHCETVIILGSSLAPACVALGLVWRSRPFYALAIIWWRSLLKGSGHIRKLKLCELQQ